MDHRSASQVGSTFNDRCQDDPESLGAGTTRRRAVQVGQQQEMNLAAIEQALVWWSLYGPDRKAGGASRPAWVVELLMMMMVMMVEVIVLAVVVVVVVMMMMMMVLMEMGMGRCGGGPEVVAESSCHVLASVLRSLRVHKLLAACMGRWWYAVVVCAVWCVRAMTEAVEMKMVVVSKEHQVPASGGVGGVGGRGGGGAGVRW